MRPASGRRGAVALLLVVACAVLVAYDLARGGQGSAAPPGHRVDGEPAAGPATATGPTAATGRTAASSPAAAPTPAPSVLVAGPGTFSYATGAGPVAGTSGPLHRYRVAVEDGTGIPAADFAAAVERILADQRSWSAQVRLQRVSGTSDAEFTVLLATPTTSEQICREEWLETRQYTNCRLSDGRVVINLDRWLTAVPDYGAPLAEYQAYAINHEVGHQLGHGHERCPGVGLPAPVMQQQTLGLQGCLAYGWPYLEGERYRGPATTGI